MQQQGETRLGQRAGVRRHPRQHPPHRLDLAVPQQPVQPVLIVLGRNCRAVIGEKTLFVDRVEVAVDPNRPQCRGPAGDIARFQLYFGSADLSGGADWWEAGKPSGGNGIGFACQSFFGVHP